MKRIVLAAMLLAMPATASAQYHNYGAAYPDYSAPYRAPPPPQTTYDWRSGNSYTTTYGSDGSSNTRGHNIQNGTQWHSRTDSNGRTTGVDGNGDMWTYDANTGIYRNINTGVVCMGRGAARNCF